jgi:hypothetical protein
MVHNKIPMSGYDLPQSMADARRRRTEASQAEVLGELAALLLPLSLALARLVARTEMRVMP